MTELLGLTGRKYAGKDAAFRFIYQWCFERGILASRRGFADSLKFSFARLFIPDCSIDEAIHWCDELKVSSYIDVEWTRGDIGRGTETTIHHTITGRTALQRYGTEAHRDVFSSDFWVDKLLPLRGFEYISDDETREWENIRFIPEGRRFEPAYWMNFIGTMYGRPDLCVVTDVRFENEARRIKDLNGTIVKVIREEEQIEDTHASEAGFDKNMIDDVIFNTETLEELGKRVYEFMEVTYGDKFGKSS